MNSRERVLLALNHQEPDHIPLDIGGTGLTTMHVTAYKNLRAHLGLPEVKPRIAYMAEQLGAIDDSLADTLETDFRQVQPGFASDFQFLFWDEGDYEVYEDEWGIQWRMPKHGGFYYDMWRHPLARAESLEEMKAHPFPDPLDDGRFAGLRAQAEAGAAQGKAVVLAGPCAGITEVYAWMRGFEAFYIDLALHKSWVAYMLDRLAEFKMAFWERALAEVGDLVDVVIEADDLAGQNNLLMSPDTYRQVILPRHKRLFQFIKDQADIKLFYHSCGAIRPLIPDLLEAGIDILNPVQISARGMDLFELKREFGDDLVFWGGGVDTQGVLDSGTPDEVRADVKRNIEALAPGGGFVFAAVHDIQANVSPENIMAMWQAWKDFGAY